MRLTRQSEIAFAILAACARRPGRPILTSAAATEAGATRLHTAKIVNLLTNAGFLTTFRGRSGGLGLNTAAEAISLGAVLRHTQPELIEGLGDRNQKRGAPRSNLATILDAASGTFVALMNRFTVADLVADRAVEHLACVDCRLVRSMPAKVPRLPQPCRERREPHVDQLPS